MYIICFNLLEGKKGKKGKPVKEKLPAAPFTLTVEQMKIADKQVASVQVPVGYGWTPGPLFMKYIYKKSHDWKLVCLVTHYCK